LGGSHLDEYYTCSVGQSTPARDQRECQLWLGTAGSGYNGRRTAAKISGAVVDDQISNPGGEAIYLRDETTGELWGPTAARCAQPHTAAVMVRPAVSSGRRHCVERVAWCVGRLREDFT
jgi:hypothetical protein